uniref:ER lumen protein-retaining receptor n=4 Tax=Hystricomorpha TaxID=33550 RepID=A0A0P6JEH4_HETGA
MRGFGSISRRRPSKFLGLSRGVHWAPDLQGRRWATGGAREPKPLPRGRGLQPRTPPLPRPPPSSRLWLIRLLGPRSPSQSPLPAVRPTGGPSPALSPTTRRNSSSGAAPRQSASPRLSPARALLPAMNLFRFLGDLSHLLAIILLLLKIWKSRSCAGISGKSQVLFAVVFTARYLDLFTNYISLYNTCMKVVYIACSFTTVWMIYSKFKATYDGNHDTFRVEFLVFPTAVLAFLVNHDFTPLEILWTFSIYLESVAILPQLFMVSKTGEAETITSHYLFALGVYRTLYLFNWIWRYHFEGFFDLIAIVAGLVQTVLYCDFFYLYITKVLKGKKLSLPA